MPALVSRLPKPLFVPLARAGSWALGLGLRGSRYTDPIDGRSYRRFLGHGPAWRRRPNVLCPGTLSLERHRLAWLYLQRETDFFRAKKRVLHVAPEACFVDRFRKLPNLEYVTGDLASPLADVEFDLHSLPFADASFDVVLCNHVLEHVADDRKCMREIERVLGSGGYGLLSVPLDETREVTLEDEAITDPRDRERLYGQSDHVRLYGRDYLTRLEAAGFTAELVQYARAFSPEEQDRFRLEPTDGLVVARKRS